MLKSINKTTGFSTIFLIVFNNINCNVSFIEVKKIKLKSFNRMMMQTLRYEIQVMRDLEI